MATAPQVPTTSGHSLSSCRGMGDKFQGWEAGREFTALVPARFLEEDCWEHPSWLPGSHPGDSATHFHCLHSPATWLSTMSFIHWNQTKTCAWKGECSAWHTHSTPCTDGQAAHRVPVSLRSCLKSLSCTQPEWAKQTPLRGQSPVLWPVDVCRQVVSAVPMLYQLGLKLSNWNRPLQFFNW